MRSLKLGIRDPFLLSGGALGEIGFGRHKGSLPAYKFFKFWEFRCTKIQYYGFFFTIDRHHRHLTDTFFKEVSVVNSKDYQRLT